MDGIKHRSGLLRKHLLAMRQNLKKPEVGTTTDRIRQYHIEALLKKLSDLLQIFNAAQMDYRTQVASLSHLKSLCGRIHILYKI